MSICRCDEKESVSTHAGGWVLHEKVRTIFHISGFFPISSKNSVFFTSSYRTSFLIQWRPPRTLLTWATCLTLLLPSFWFALLSLTRNGIYVSMLILAFSFFWFLDNFDLHRLQVTKNKTILLHLIMFTLLHRNNSKVDRLLADLCRKRRTILQNKIIDISRTARS